MLSPEVFVSCDVLSVTSARGGKDAACEPLAGSVFAEDAGVPGVPASIFED